MGKTKVKIMFWAVLILIIGFISPARMAKADEENESSKQVITENEDETEPTDSDDIFIEDSVEQNEEDNTTNEQDEVSDLYEFDNNAMAPANTSEPISIEFSCSDNNPNELFGDMQGGYMYYNIAEMLEQGTLVMQFSNGDTLHFTLSYIPDGIIENYPFKCTENNAKLTVKCTSNKNEWFIGYDAAVVNLSCVYNNKELSCVVPIKVIPNPNSISYEEAQSNAIPIGDGATLNANNMVSFYINDQSGKEIQVKGVMTYIDVPYKSIATISYSCSTGIHEYLYFHVFRSDINYSTRLASDINDPYFDSSFSFLNNESTSSIRYYILVDMRDFVGIYSNTENIITQNLNVTRVENQGVENTAVQIPFETKLEIYKIQPITFSTQNGDIVSGIITYIDIPYLTTITIEIPNHYYSSYYPINIHEGNRLFYDEHTWSSIKVSSAPPYDLILTNVTSKDPIRYYLWFDHAYFTTYDYIYASKVRTYLNEYGLYGNGYNLYCGSLSTDNIDNVYGWKRMGKDWYYFDEKNGGKAKHGWFYDTDYTYYFGSDGIMKTGQQTINNVQYYFSNSGALKTGWQTDGSYWYYTNKFGSKQIGWLKDKNGTYYYLDNDGKMVIGFKTIDYVTYYFNENGAMHKGWKSFGSGDDMWWYYFNKDGSRVYGWKNINGVWYYFDVLGIMQTGWFEEKEWYEERGKKYYFTSSGAMKTGWMKEGSDWYYFTSSGEMKRGWKQIDNAWYYFKEDGKMAVNETIDGYKIGADGKMK